MKTFFDSSAFAKRYVDEDSSDLVETLCASAGSLGLCVLCVPEIVSALNRRVREATLSNAQYRHAKARLSIEVADAVVINLVPSVIAVAITILETYVVRASDALHVACAHEWRADLFVSSDERQLAAARGVGLGITQV